MRPATLLALGALVAASVAAQSPRPVIAQGSVLNQFSNTFDGLPNSGVAQGSIVVVYLANQIPAPLELATRFPLSKLMNGVSVKLTSGGVDYDAFMIYTGPTQVGFLLPSNMPLGDAALTVAYNGVVSPAVTVRVLERAPGFATISQNGRGAGVFTDANFKVFTPLYAANPNEAVTAWLTGTGAVQGDEGAAPLPANISVPNLEFFVGGVPATTTYTGRSGCCAGLDQWIFRIPPGVEGCSVPVVAKWGEFVSNVISIPIASSGRTCSDRSGLSASDLQRLIGGGTFTTGAITLTRARFRGTFSPPLGTVESIQDTGNAAFFKLTEANVATSTATAGFPTLGSCTTVISKGTGFPQFTTTPAALDAGGQITITGPPNAKALTKTAEGTYSGTLGGGALGDPNPAPLFLNPGERFTAENGTGGADIRRFSVPFMVSDPLTWLNRDSFAAAPIPTNQPLTFRWSGGDPNSIVVIVLASARQSPDVSVAVLCAERVGASQFTVPLANTLALPSSAVQSVSGFNVPMGAVILGTNVTTTFSGGLDKGFLFLQDAYANVVQFVRP